MNRVNVSIALLGTALFQHMSQQKRIGDRLVEASIITHAQLEEALRLQEQRYGFLGQILLDKGWITDMQLCQAVSEALNVNCVSIDSVLVGEDLIQLVPASLAVSSGILPLFVHHNVLYLAMENPLDSGVIQLIEHETSMQIRPLTAPPCQLWKMINLSYHLDDLDDDSASNMTFPENPQEIEKKIFRKMRQEQRKRLGDFLVETGLLSQAQLNTALELQEGKLGFLGQLLVDMGWISEHDLCQALSEMLHVESVMIDEAQIDPDVMRYVPYSLAESCNVLPLFIDHRILYLAMENPLDTGVIQLIQYETGLKVEPLVAPLSQIHRMIERYYQSEDRPPSWKFNVPGASDR